MHNHHSSQLPAWHSLLFVPAQVKKFVESAAKRGADAILLDLEDSVPLASKAEARQLLEEHAKYLKQQGCDLVVRVNRDLQNCLPDLQAAVINEVSAICLPKAMGAEHVLLVDEVMTEIEMSKGLAVGQVKLIAMVETLEALSKVNLLAKACPRLAALALGTEDLGLDGGFEVTPDNLFAPAQQVVHAAHMANIKAFGFPGSIADYSNIGAFEQLIQRGKSMGFDGALCIHPNQVKVVNKIYQIDPEELARAQKIVQAYEQAILNKRAAVEVDGKMVDLPVVERARKLVLEFNS